MILRNALLFLSRRIWLRQWVENSRLSRPFTKKFIAGKTLEEALSICGKLNAEGILATVDYLGENINSIEEAAVTRDAYLTVLAEIARRGLKATISIKLTHFGIDFSEDVCREYVSDVMAAAHKTGNSVEFDMEALTHVDRTLQMVMDQHAAHGSVPRGDTSLPSPQRERYQKAFARWESTVRLCKRGIQRTARGGLSTQKRG